MAGRWIVEEGCGKRTPQARARALADSGDGADCRLAGFGTRFRESWRFVPRRERHLPATIWTFRLSAANGRFEKNMPFKLVW